MARSRSIVNARILVTGASQGIGRSLALAAAKQGAKVLATARNEALLADLVEDAKNAGLTIKTLKADVINPADRLAMIGAMSERFGGMDILINNAGIGATGHFTEANEERLRSIFEVNFFALAELVRIAVPVLKQGVNPAVVNISSVLGKRALPGRSEYSASKFAVQGLSEALRGELSKDGIDVIVINPGFTATNFSQNMLERNSKFQADHMRGMTADQVAEGTLRAVARGTNDVTFTFQGKLLLFLNRHFPRLVDWIINRRVKRLYGAKAS
jgi:short-subunit dehydrogenase